MTVLRKVFGEGGRLPPGEFCLAVALLVALPFVIIAALVLMGGPVLVPQETVLLPIVLLAWLCGRRSSDAGRSAVAGWLWTGIAAFGPILALVLLTMAGGDLSQRLGYSFNMTWENFAEGILIGPLLGCILLVILYARLPSRR